MIRLIALAIAVTGALSAQTIERFELRKQTGASEGNLIVVVKDRELRVANKAIAVWPAWVATQLLYSQRATAADGTTEGEELRIYDAPSSLSTPVTVENASIKAVTHVLLGGGEVALVITMQDSERTPWVALANTKVGVYRRERLAAPGPITNDSVEIRHFEPEDLKRANGEISKIPPSRVSMARLVPGDPSPLGNWVATLPAADASRRNVTLTLYPGGPVRLSMEFPGKGLVTRKGAWSQIDLDLVVVLEPIPGRELPSSMRWELKPNELTPKTWDKDEFGTVGLPLKRSAAPWTRQ